MRNEGSTEERENVYLSFFMVLISLFSWCLSIDPATELLYCGKTFGTHGPLKVFRASAKIHRKG